MDIKKILNIIPLNRELSIPTHMMFTLTGVVLAVGAYKGFLYFYRNLTEMNHLDSISYMMLCVMASFLGIFLLFMNLDFQDSKTKLLVLFSCGIAVGVSLCNKVVMVAIILLLVDFAAFIIVMRFKNVFSTVFTFVLGLTGALVVIVLISHFSTNINELGLLYLTMLGYFAAYRSCGVKINQWFIRKGLGSEKEAGRYDLDQLIYLMTLLYFIVFFIITFLEFTYETHDSQVSTVINNIFLSGLMLTQIRWEKIVNM